MFQSQYLRGVGWFTLSLITSVMNDVLSKNAGLTLHPLEVALFRFLFSALTLIPVILYFGVETIKTSSPLVHFMRGLILFFGISAWTYGLTSSTLATATLISFTIPLFTLILAYFFLKEDITWQRWLATIAGFAGIAIAVEVVNFSGSAPSYNNGIAPNAIIFVAAAIGFASLDIINKKFVVKETMTSMLFYSALVTALLAVVPASFHWQNPTYVQLFQFLILGASANLILFFILKAFSVLDATAVAPFRYLEILLSSGAGYLLFSETVTMNIIYGSVVIIPSTLFIIYSENKKSK